MLKSVMVFLIGVMFAFSAHAESFTAKVNRNPVPLGETFVLTLQYDGAPGDSSPDLTSLNKDFKVYSVGREYRQSIVNGTSKTTYLWNVVMSPKVADTALIPAISFKHYQSQPISIKVVAENASGSNVPKFSVGRSVNNDKPFVQEQIIYTLILKTTEDLRGNLPEFADNGNSDWIIKQIDSPQAVSEIENGIETHKIEIHYAMFPQKSGKLKTPELNFSGYYFDHTKANNRRFSGVFGGFTDNFFGGFGDNAAMTQINLSARPIEVDVKPIPAENNGSWWLPSNQVELTSDWDEKIPEFKAGEAVNREITLAAAGVADTQLPKLRFKETEGLKQYPEKPEYKSVAVDNGVVSSMSVKVVYIPEYGGKITIPEIVVPWYNLKTQTMEKAVLPAVEVEVKGDAAVVPESKKQSAVVATESVNRKNLTETEQILSIKMILAIIALAFAAGLGVSWMLLRRVALRPAGKTEEKPSPDIKKAVREKDLKAVRDEILLWARQCFPQEKIRNLDDVERLFDNKELSDILRQIGSNLYSGRSGNFDFEKLEKLMTALGKKKQKSKKEKALLPELYK